MSKPNENSTVDDLTAARRKAPWTARVRELALVVLGSAAFALFLYFMFLKTQGATIAYEDLFLLLSVSGALLGINFGINLLDAVNGNRRRRGGE